MHGPLFAVNQVLVWVEVVRSLRGVLRMSMMAIEKKRLGNARCGHPHAWPGEQEGHWAQHSPALLSRECACGFSLLLSSKEEKQPDTPHWDARAATLVSFF